MVYTNCSHTKEAFVEHSHVCGPITSQLLRHPRKIPIPHPCPSHAMADIATSDTKIFTVLNALKGYHQCPLDADSQALTTFITPFSRYKYLQTPYGISSISEHYNRRMTEAFSGLSGFRRIVDDFVIYDNNVTDHVKHVEQFLQRCVENNIALNMEKCQFLKAQVTFAGFSHHHMDTK